MSYLSKYETEKHVKEIKLTAKMWWTEMMESNNNEIGKLCRFANITTLNNNKTKFLLKIKYKQNE